jgi:hypothetical protein
MHQPPTQTHLDQTRHKPAAALITSGLEDAREIKINAFMNTQA